MKYDLVVIGGGPGGYGAVIKAAQNGMRTALVEKGEFSETCKNKGCISTKALLHASRMYREMQNADRLGITVGNVGYNIEKIYAYKDNVVSKLAYEAEQLIKTYKIDVYKGKGIIERAGRVRVGQSQELETDKILIATGSTSIVPSIPGVGLENVITSDELLKKPLPDIKRLTVIGGGVIGLEIAKIFLNLGCSVTIIEALDRIIANMDKELSQNITMLLTKAGVKIHTSSVVNRIEKTQKGLNCIFSEKIIEHRVESDAVLVSAGRKPCVNEIVNGLNLELINNKIAVDKCYRTNIAGVYAIGDVIGGIQLAHAAAAEGALAVEHMLGREPSIDINAVPSCIYTSPEMAQVGLTAEEAKKLGIKVRIGKAGMLVNGRSTIEEVERGFVKILADESMGVILGASIMGARATDLISEAALMISNRLTVEQALSAIRPYPTFAEMITEALEPIANGRMF